MSTDKRQLARQLIAQGRFNDARAALSRLCRDAPDDADAWLMLGSVNGRLRDAVGAERCFRKAIKARPSMAAAHYNLGIALRDQRRYDEAESALYHATELRSDYADAWNALGFVLVMLRKPEAAAEAFRVLCQLSPQSAEAHGNYANACNLTGNVENAIAEFRKAISLNGKEAFFHSNLANLLGNQGRLDEALEEYRRSFEVAPGGGSPGLHSNYLLNLHYLPATDPQLIFEEHRQRGNLFVKEGPTPVFLNDPIAERRLRVGYVSADFREHSVAYFLEPLLAHHDRAQLDTICYSGVPRPDATTARFEAMATRWYTIHDKSDADVVQMVRSHKIDILVDLSGHTGSHRLAVFGQRAAPVQVTYLGYPGTTGLATMDYRLTDEWADPPGLTERYYTEKLWRLPSGFLCYQAPRGAPEPASAPWEHNQFITFGSFNNLSKVNERVIALWSRILKAVPGSRLALKFHCLGDASTRALFCERFKRHAIDEDRLDLLAATPTTAAHLETYSRVDIALDPFPYNGTTTTCEALWMGVPVISLIGSTHTHRVGNSLLSRAGLRCWIADNEQAYLKLAMDLAMDHEKRVKWRATLRQTLQASALCDGKGIAKAVEAAYLGMWQERYKTWCNSGRS